MGRATAAGAQAVDTALAAQRIAQETAERVAREVATRIADEVRKAITDVTATVEKNTRKAAKVGLVMADQAGRTASKTKGKKKKKDKKSGK